MTDDNENLDDLDLENGHYSEHSDSDETRSDSETGMCCIRTLTFC